MLDVAIGLLVLFLVTSVMASAIVEAVGGFLHRRQKHLWDSLDLLLGNTSTNTDPDLRIVNELYTTPFITGLVPPASRRFFDPADTSFRLNVPVRGRGTWSLAKPNRATADKRQSASNAEQLNRRFYGPVSIDSAEFADSLLSLVRPEGRADAGLHELSKAEVVAALDRLPADLRAKLGAVVAEAGDSFVEVRDGIAQWFDRNMTAASRWYRKQTRWFLFLAGLVLAVSLNIDALHATATLYRDRETRAAIVAQAEQIAAADCLEVGDGAAEGTASARLDCLRDGVGGSVRLPIGWTGADWDGATWIARPLGWLIVAAGVTLGAPFWFDLLGRALKLRSSRQKT